VTPAFSRVAYKDGLEIVVDNVRLQVIDGLARLCGAVRYLPNRVALWRKPVTRAVYRDLRWIGS
jgi:hypothetical protein